MATAVPADGELIACDRNCEWTDVARRYWDQAGIADRITLHLAPAADTLEKLLQEGHESTVDFAFIDADKINYDTYYEQCLRLLKPGGLIGLDNTLRAGWSVADPDETAPGAIAMRALNKKVHQDARVEMSMLPIGDGLTLIRKR